MNNVHNIKREKHKVKIGRDTMITKNHKTQKRKNVKLEILNIFIFSI